jgi:hypothetical protein
MRNTYVHPNRKAIDLDNNSLDNFNCHKSGAKMIVVY